MRPVWVTLFVVFAFAASSVAGAAAMSACLMNAASPPVTMVSEHHCCPNNHGTNNKSAPQNHKMDGCLIGMVCGSAPVVAPASQSIQLSSISFVLTRPILGEPAPPSGPLQELFRPPRTV